MRAMDGLCAFHNSVQNHRLSSELCLGLVHYTDGLIGTRRRLATAQKYVKNFSIATECGFGRRPADTIPELLRIHAAAAE